MRKAQASLEMVVGLIVLLVVAGVVISLVLHYINPKRIPNPNEQMDVRAFLDKCEEFCEDRTTLKYCTYYYPGRDWNKNGKKDELIKVGDYNWYACEDRIYCFLVVPCEKRFGSGKKAIETCKELLCQTYNEKYGDLSYCDKALNYTIKVSSSTTCVKKYNALPDEEKWWNEIFEKGCSGNAHLTPLASSR